MKVLCISDVVVSHIYSPAIKDRFSGIDIVISCGDIPYYYQEFIISMLDVPLFFVRGNHDKLEEYGDRTKRTAPGGGINLHRQVVKYNNLLLAGVEGSLRYRGGPFQYSQSEMWLHVFQLMPRLFVNRIRSGRYLDVFVTHAPLRGVHDKPDLTHQGINAFRWLDMVFKPAYHIHGHIHVYHPEETTQSSFGDTLVVNSYGYQELDLVSSTQREARLLPDSAKRSA